MNNNQGKVKSVIKAVCLIDCLAQAKRALTLQELAQRAGYPKSTTHALLASLCDSSLVEQSDDGKYRLGVRLFELGNIVSSSWDILYIARMHIQNIAFKTGESVQLTTLDKNEVLVLETEDSNNALRVMMKAGSRMPSYCTAPGKAMLAFLPEEKVKTILHATKIYAFTPHTYVEPDKLKAELNAIRESSFAIENGEYRIGLRAIAAPIFDITGAPKYAIGVYGMYRRITDDDFILAQGLVQVAAKTISQELGYKDYL